MHNSAASHSRSCLEVGGHCLRERTEILSRGLISILKANCQHENFMLARPPKPRTQRPERTPPHRDRSGGSAPGCIPNRLSTSQQPQGAPNRNTKADCPSLWGRVSQHLQGCSLRRPQHFRSQSPNNKTATECETAACESSPRFRRSSSSLQIQCHRTQ